MREKIQKPKSLKGEKKVLGIIRYFSAAEPSLFLARLFFFFSPPAAQHQPRHFLAFPARMLPRAKFNEMLHLSWKMQQLHSFPLKDAWRVIAILLYWYQTPRTQDFGRFAFVLQPPPMTTGRHRILVVLIRAQWDEAVGAWSYVSERRRLISDCRVRARLSAERVSLF